jgi:hypothetical protein
MTDALTNVKKKLQDEITTLEHEMNVELPKELMKARAHGDLSENAEYKYAKERQGYVSARLGQLKKRLEPKQHSIGPRRIRLARLAAGHQEIGRGRIQVGDFGGSRCRAGFNLDNFAHRKSASRT